MSWDGLGRICCFQILCGSLSGGISTDFLGWPGGSRALGARICVLLRGSFGARGGWRHISKKLVSL